MTRLVLGLLVVLIAASLLQAQQSISHAAAPKVAPASQSADLGSLTDGVYRNVFFGFSVQLPYGWVDRTDTMRGDSAESGKPDTSKGLVLLATFEHPPEATAANVNSAIVIAAESASSYPGLKSAGQYFGPIEELAKANGFTVVNEPYEFPVDGAPIVREDFSKKIKNQTMVQSSLAMLRKGYIVSFTFIGSSDDEVTQNLEFLRFGAPKIPPRK
jgi:hypothetical protein